MLSLSEESCKRYDEKTNLLEDVNPCCRVEASVNSTVEWMGWADVTGVCMEIF